MQPSAEVKVRDARLPPNRRSRWVVGISAALLLFALVVVMLPWILSRTQILNGLLRGGLAEHEIDATVGAARFGWFTSASIENVQLVDRQRRWSLSADHASSELTLWQLIWSGGVLGEFRIVGPTLLVSADRPWPAESPPEQTDAEQSTGSGQLTITIQNGRVLVRSHANEPPHEFIKGVNLTVDYEQDEGWRTVVVHPGRPVEQLTVTKEMCDLGIKYVVPILANVTWVRGAMSLELERCEITLDDPTESDVQGRLTIHSVESGLDDSLAQQVKMLAARFGAEGLPNGVRLAHESVVPFWIRDGRVEHQSLAFGLPSVSANLVITTEGSVGMDKSLDLVATLPPVGEWLGDGPLGRALSSRPLQLPIYGTLDEPKISLTGYDEIAQSLLEQVAKPLNDGEMTDENLINTIDSLGETVGDVLDRLRERRRQRRERLNRD